MEIFKLFGSIFIDNNKANESISKTESKMSALTEKVGKGIKTVATVGAAVGGAVSAGVGALTALANKSAETCDRVDKMSAKIGISKQSFQEWDYVLGQNGMDVEKLQVGVKTLVSQMDSANSGSKTSAEAFRKLGLSVTDSTGKLKSQETMLNETIRALAKMEDKTERSRLATQLLGKSGIELAPMLEQGVESIDELTKRSHELGLVMSDDAVTAGVVLGDTMDDVKKTFGAIMTQIGVRVMPIVQKFLDWVLEHMPEIQKVIGVVFKVIEIVVNTAIECVKWLIDWFKNLSQSNSETSSEMMEIWNSIKDFFMATFDLIATIISNAVKGWMLIWDTFGDDITKYVSIVFKLVGDIIKTVLDLITGIFNIFVDIFKGDWGKLWDDIKLLFINYWNNIKNLFGDYINGLVTLFTDIIPNIFNAGVNIMTGLWDGIKSIWEGICNWFTEKITWITDKLAFWKKSKDEMTADSKAVSTADGSVTKSVSTTKNTTSNVTNNYTVNAYSPKALTPTETAKAFKTSTRNMALGVS